MSVTRIVSIHCDGCGQWQYDELGGEGTAYSIRLQLRRQGWRVGERGMDICPTCQARNEQ